MSKVLVGVLGFGAFVLLELALWKLLSVVVRKDTSETSARAQSPGRKSVALAVILALCLPGFGHLYIHRLGLGIAFLIPILICALRLVGPSPVPDQDARHLTIVVWVVLQVAQTVSAGVLAARRNRAWDEAPHA